MKTLQIINGRWSYKAEPNEVLDYNKANEFTDFIKRVGEFSKGSNLSHMKIKVLASILNTNEETDKALVRILDMNKKEIENINKLY